jgi:hypothetical protein
LGVRFVISNVEHVEEASLRGNVKIPFAKDEYTGFETLRLFEVKNANIAGISARRIVSVDSLDKADVLLGNPAFDGTTAVLLDIGGQPSHVPAVLEPATQSEIRTETHGWHIRAKSNGVTMLVLPMEYSHCMDITVVSGNPPEALRTDVALTGLIFDRELDVKIVLQTGLFTHPRCRMQDYKESSSMLKSAP